MPAALVKAAGGREPGRERERVVCVVSLGRLRLLWWCVGALVGSWRGGGRGGGGVSPEAHSRLYTLTNLTNLYQHGFVVLRAVETMDRG
jgi:hypothetical protein